MVSTLALLPLIVVTARADTIAFPAKDVSSEQVSISDRVPEGFTTWDAFIQAQNYLDAAADAVHGLAAQSATSRFGSIVVDQAKKQMTLYWKGDPPAEIARIAAAMPSGYSIRSYPAAYDNVTLSIAVQRAVETLGDASIAFTFVAPKADSSGIEVGVPGATGPATAVLRNFEVTVQVASGGLSLVSQRLIPRPSPPPRGRTGPGRLYDVPLYWGGGKWYTYTTQAFPSEMCSTAFAVLQGGKTKLLTAGHCPGNEVFTKVAPGYQIFNHEGYIEQRLLKPGLASPDIELINPDTSGSEGVVWFGGAEPSSDHGNAVGKSEFVNVGDLICTDGASSLKLHCAGKVLHTGETVAYGTGEIVSGVDDAQSMDDTPLSIDGDSGGPVLFPCCLNKWAAQGIISGGGWSGIYGYGTVFTPIKNAESLYGATTLTK